MRTQLRREVLALSLIAVSMSMLLWSGTRLSPFAFALLIASLARINYLVYKPVSRDAPEHREP